MSGPFRYDDLAPERIERLVLAARIERAKAVRAAFAGVFRWLRGLRTAKPSRQPEVHAAPC
jgi:hypothetical protein